MTRKDRSSSPSTLINLTGSGREAFDSFLQTLEQIVAQARSDRAR